MDRYKPAAQCKACGYGGDWDIGGACFEPPASTTFIDRTEEGSPITVGVLHRVCNRCGYSWDETPLDAVAKALDNRMGLNVLCRGRKK